VGGAGGMGGSKSPAPLPPPATQLAPGSWCEPNGWCWYNPLPSGNFLNAVAGAGRTDLWIAGESFISSPSSNALHFDGSRWSIVPTPLGLVSAIWAASVNDVWFVGDDDAFEGHGAIAHWDGTAITLVTPVGAPVATGVWGASANDVYAVAGAYGGGNEIALHWDGTAWTPIPGVGGTQVAGSGPNDVWIGGSAGLLHFDGTRFAPVAALAGQPVVGLTVAAPGDVWMIVVPQPGEELVEHLDSTGLTVTMDLTSNLLTLSSISASSPQSVWLVGSESTLDGMRLGYLAHNDGQSWTRAPDAPTALDKVQSAPGLGDIAVGDNGSIVRLTTTPTLGFTDLRTGSDRTLAGVFGSSPTDMWAVGAAGTIWHYDGHAVVAVPAGTAADLTDVWGTGPSDVWAVGTAGTVLHFDGSAFAPVASGTTVDLRAVFTARPNDVWIGGDSATLLHWDGSNMTPVALAGIDPGDTIRDLHGVAANDVWLCGGEFIGPGPNGFVSHFDGAGWSPALPLTFPVSGLVVSQPLARIWELAPNDVWVSAGQLNLRGGGPDAYQHFDGQSWSEMLLASTFPLPDPPFMFPNRDRPSFVFGPHDRWLVDVFGIWQRNTN
jgi:hypothetical protein